MKWQGLLGVTMRVKSIGVIFVLVTGSIIFVSHHYRRCKALFKLLQFDAVGWPRVLG